MAPFLTHLLVGERVWNALDGRENTPEDYGTFLFGCLAPDVDKVCNGLEQGTTHFVGKDEGGTYQWRRSQHFLEYQTDFLRAPFLALAAGEQSFVLGYLCHVATDEITARLATDLGARLAKTSRQLPDPDAMPTAMDPRLWSLVAEPKRIVAALETATIPDSTLSFVPPACLVAMHQIVVPQVREGGGLVPYLDMLRRQKQWLRHGQVSDTPDDPELEAELAAIRGQIEDQMPVSEQLVETMEPEPFVENAVRHSLHRIHALQAKEGEP